MKEENKPFSIHIFMYPFKWKEDMKNFNEVLNLLSAKGWMRKEFIIERSIHYKEFVYYHPFVQKMVFDTGNTDSIRYMEYPLAEDAAFEFDIADYSKAFKAKLALKGVSVHLFFTGVGILTFKLENYQSGDLCFIKYLNDYGRRTYPQFLVDNNDSDVDFDYTSKVKKTFLPNSIKVKYGNNYIVEDFRGYRLPIPIEETITPPAYIKHIMPIDKIIPLNDDRMYTMCWYGNNELAKSLTRKHNNTLHNYSYQTSDEWYSLIFCDKSDSSCQSLSIRNEHLKRYTYDRWANYGTLYGITRDSLICLTSEWDDLIENYADHLVETFQTVYYQMAIICLAQRSSLNKFSCELSTILSDEKKITENVEGFQTNYFKFNNQLYFKEVTSQIQGIEMYSMMQQSMQIDGDAMRLDREIEELHNLMSIRNSSKIDRQMLQLTKIALYFTPASILLAFASLFVNNTFASKTDSCPAFFWVIIIAGILVYIGAVVLMKSLINKKNKKLCTN